MPRARKAAAGIVRQAPEGPLARVRPCWEYLTARSDDGRMWAPPFAALGAEGWELIAVYKTGDAMYAPAYYAVFKREVRG